MGGGVIRYDMIMRLGVRYRVEVQEFDFFVSRAFDRL